MLRRSDTMIRHGYGSDDSVFATAIAASANAIHSLERNSQAEIGRANTRKQEPLRPPPPGPIRKASIRDARNSSSLRPGISFAENQRHREASTTLTSSDSKADAWEKAQIAKIRKRYERVHSEIQAWENEKKAREKHQMERKKAELELRKSKNLKHYQSKIGRIDRLAKGAKAQVEEKQKHEESIVKAKARKMRLTGIAPIYYQHRIFLKHSTINLKEGLKKMEGGGTSEGNNQNCVALSIKFQAKLELRNSRNLKHYQSKIGRIDRLAKGAKAQVEEKQKHEESIVKAKARKMRLTGIAPVSCFCF